MQCRKTQDQKIIYPVFIIYLTLSLQIGVETTPGTLNEPLFLWSAVVCYEHAQKLQRYIVFDIAKLLVRFTAVFPWFLSDLIWVSPGKICNMASNNTAMTLTQVISIFEQENTEDIQNIIDNVLLK